LVLGVDGGTSKTLALVADISTASIVGFGSAGGSNFQANGLSKSGKEIQKVIEQASRGLKSALFIEAAFEVDTDISRLFRIKSPQLGS